MSKDTKRLFGVSLGLEKNSFIAPEGFLLEKELAVLHLAGWRRPSAVDAKLVIGGPL